MRTACSPRGTTRWSAAVKTIAIPGHRNDRRRSEQGHLLEVACVLWSVEHRAVIEARSWLLEQPPSSEPSEPSDRRQRHRPWRCSSTATAAGTSKRPRRSSRSTSTPSRLGTLISTAHGSLSIFRNSARIAAVVRRDGSGGLAHLRSRGRSSRRRSHGVSVADAPALTDCSSRSRASSNRSLDKARRADDHPTIAMCDRRSADNGSPAHWRPRVHVEVADKGLRRSSWQLRW